MMRRRRRRVHPPLTAPGVFRPALAANAGQCLPAQTRDVPVGSQDAIAPTAGAAGAPTSCIRAQGNKTGHQTGGGSGAAQRDGSSGSEIRDAIARGNTKNATESKHKDKD